MTAVFLFVGLAQSARAFSEGDRARSKYSVECLASLVASRMNVVLRSEIAFPRIVHESEITLPEFQDVVEPWWGFRPGAITNVYIPTREEIYLIDDPEYYRKFSRYLEDSLAHELAHFIQVRYLNADLKAPDDSLESQAIDIQTWLRETHLRDGSVPCK